MNINNVIQFILSPHFSDWLMLIRILFVVATLVLLGFIIFALANTLWLKRLFVWDLQEILTFRPFGVRRIVRGWLRIKTRLDTGMESEYKLAVIEADSMLDEILKGMGFDGESLGDRLDRLTLASLPNLKEVKAAHLTRNNIVHDPNYRLSLDEAKKTIEIFEKSLTDLQAL